MTDLLALWPAAITPAGTWLVIVAVLIAGLIRGFSGFGSAMVMAPAFAIAMGPATGVPLLILLDLLVAAVILPPVLPRVAWRQVMPLSLGALVVLPFGAHILTVADEEILKRGTGLLILLFTGLMATGWRYHGRPALAV
ncbi:MAG: TSUP family transporter, partial [Alphaproteobacteria bacterium]